MSVIMCNCQSPQ